MPLNNHIVSQFVKNTKSNNTTRQKETIVYGKLIKTENDTYYVQIDGANDNSDPIPVSKFTARVDTNQRVIVMIKNHTAIVTGNISEPSANSKFVEGIVDNKIHEIPVIDNDTIDHLWVVYESSKWK